MCGILQISLLNVEVFVTLLRHVMNIDRLSHRQQTPRLQQAVGFKPPDVLCGIESICEMFTAYGVLELDWMIATVSSGPQAHPSLSTPGMAAGPGPWLSSAQAGRARPGFAAELAALRSWLSTAQAQQ